MTLVRSLLGDAKGGGYLAPGMTLLERGFDVASLQDVEVLALCHDCPEYRQMVLLHVL